jgi:multidrug resistance protein MdtO
VVQGNGPEFDLAVARDRVVGILVGNIVTYLVFTRVYPVSITARVDSALARVVRLLATAPAAVGAAIAAVSNDLMLARYEPAPARPSAGWLAARTDAAHAVAMLQAPLLLDRHVEPSLGPRFQRIADAIETLSEPFDLGPAETPSGPLQAIIEAHLCKLEQEAAVMAAQGRDDGPR